MQAAKIKNERGIDAYTDNLAMKIAVGTSNWGVLTSRPSSVDSRTLFFLAIFPVSSRAAP